MGGQILNTLDKESQPTVRRVSLQLADSGLELANSSTDSNADAAKFSVWVLALGHMRRACIDKDSVVLLKSIRRFERGWQFSFEIPYC